MKKQKPSLLLAINENSKFFLCFIIITFWWMKLYDLKSYRYQNNKKNSYPYALAGTSSNHWKGTAEKEVSGPGPLGYTAIVYYLVINVKMRTIYLKSVPVS